MHCSSLVFKVCKACGHHCSVNSSTCPLCVSGCQHDAPYRRNSVQKPYVRCAPLCIFGAAEAPEGLPHVSEHEQALILERLQRL